MQIALREGDLDAGVREALVDFGVQFGDGGQTGIQNRQLPVE